MSYEICYIDDKILPEGGIVANETGLISKGEISGLISQDSWAEPTVKRFLSATIAKSNKFKQIQFSGFTHPNFFLNHITNSNYQPNSIILDWDYGESKAEETIQEIIARTTSKIFILSGNELESDIEDVLNPIRQQYNDRRLEIFSKSIHEEDEKTQENLLETLLSDLTSISEDKRYHDVNVKFYPSSFLPSFELFWMAESILGSDFIISFFSKNNPEISHLSIEKMFEESNVKFYINAKNTRIYSENGITLSEFYNDKDKLKPITAIYAIKNYDLSILETAFEKGSSKTFQNHEG
ncbi:hypothetical protein [Candidatus Pollutiaquabacter sp.]|uniref:hypothetical protein n=1 Tax=Candidatus Pollutiaquabacter sp. TaxID=3416354 RepID=UPI003C9E9328|nr:hypothetical protein [Bacteroidota bacterium]